MTKIILLLIIGLSAGIISGVAGIGGGVIIVPALILIFGFSQHTAQGTTLALMLPPIGLLGTYVYYKNGFVDFKAAALICAGFIIGGYLGSKFAVNVAPVTLQKIFAGIIILTGIYMLAKK